MQPLHRVPLSADHRLGLRHLRLDAAAVESGQHLPAVNVVPLLSQNLDDPLAVVERELNLPEIDVPVKRQLLGCAIQAMIIPPGAAPPAASSKPTTIARFMRLPRSPEDAKTGRTLPVARAIQDRIGESSTPTRSIIRNVREEPLAR